jgi:hypothetical protein
MFLMGSKPANQAGLGISNWRIVDDRTIAITFINPTAAPITPTAAQVYTIAAFNEMPAINNIVMYGVNVGTTTAIAVTTAVNWTISVRGVDVNDALISVAKPTLDPGIIIVPQGCTANNVVFQVNNFSWGGGGLPITDDEVYACAVWRRNPPAVGNLFNQLLTPTACALNTITEQIFTVVGIPAFATVWVNKPSYTPGIAIGSVRCVAADTVRIAFINTSAVAITPPPENYIIYSFPNLAQGLTTSWCSTAASLTFNQLIDLANEMQTSKVITGFMKGS